MNNNKESHYMRKKTKNWITAITVLLMIPGAYTYNMARETGFWYIWFWQRLEDIGFDMEMDETSYDKLTFTYVGENAAHNVYITVREDFSYEGGGFTSRTVYFNTIEPNQVQIVPWNYGNDGFEIGLLEVWIKCDRGKAYAFSSWSPATDHYLITFFY